MKEPEKTSFSNADQTGAFTPGTPEASNGDATHSQSEGFLNSMAELYFTPKSFESASLYEHIGVRWYKRWMPTSGDKVARNFAHTTYGKALSSPLQKMSNTQEAVQQIITDSKRIEIIHLGLTAFYGVLEVGTHELAHSLPWDLWWGGAQVVVNAYPIIVQRYNRLRAERVLGLLAIRNDRGVEI